jgi:hypothetical protein
MMEGLSLKTYLKNTEKVQKTYLSCSQNFIRWSLNNKKIPRQLSTWFRMIGIEDLLFGDRPSLKWKQILDF